MKRILLHTILIAICCGAVLSLIGQGVDAVVGGCPAAHVSPHFGHHVTASEALDAAAEPMEETNDALEEQAGD